MFNNLASKNLNIFNTILEWIMYVCIVFSSSGLFISFVAGVITRESWCGTLLSASLYSLGILITTWITRCFTKGFETIVTASEKIIEKNS